MTTIPPCAGKHELFDSTHWLDHRVAAALCKECPMVAACQERLNETREQTIYGGVPQGTWAGQLVGGPAGSRHFLIEEQMFNDIDARTAHAAWVRGVRDDRTSIGERVYQRRMKRAKTKGQAA